MNKIIGSFFKVKVDRMAGTHHPKHTDIIYPINYGYVEGIKGGDGEWQDVYILGSDKPLKSFYGPVIAIIHRFDDNETKWVMAIDPEKSYSKEEIKDLTNFQEQFFNIYIEM